MNEPDRHTPTCYILAALDVALILVLIVTIIIVAGRWLAS